jgi:predicted nucleic acid-binding protein
MVIVFDTDILSMFAKIDEVYLLKQLFGDKAVMTPKVRDEISAPLEYGYTFPLEVLSAIKTVPLSKEAIEEYVRFQGKLNLGKGELEAIAYCKTGKSIFATNDERAREFAKSEGIQVFSLQAILKALWKKKLKSKGEIKQILERIKTADNLTVSKEIEKGIFED